MNKIIVILCLMVLSRNISGQNLMDNSWIMGSAAYITADFNGMNNPSVNLKYTNAPYYFEAGSSNICDSLTGKILFSCNGMQIYDSTGNLMQDGDHLVPDNYYYQNAFPSSFTTQSSLILPKGPYNSGQYYVFVGAVSDSTYNNYWLNSWGFKTPYDMLSYNVVDMNENGGLGKVILKNQPLIIGTDLSRVGMQACKHANGKDWWLLKQGLNSNIIYKILITKDSIMGPFIQTFTTPVFGWYDATGQSAFSDDGKKYAYSNGTKSKLFMADFDRCYGLLSNPKVFNIPIDSTTHPYYDSLGQRDSICTGLCFSSNGNFLYISKQFNIYQFEYNQSDSSQAWYRVKHGPDTSLIAFEDYLHLYKGKNQKIYISKWGGQLKQMSVIENPNNKGLGCGFCRKCFRKDDNLNWGLGATPNMPNYQLGADTGYCAPVVVENINYQTRWEIYPNPVTSTIYIKHSQHLKKELFNYIGQLIISTFDNEIDVSHLSKGVYFLRCEGINKKVRVE